VSITSQPPSALAEDPEHDKVSQNISHFTWFDHLSFPDYSAIKMSVTTKDPRPLDINTLLVVKDTSEAERTTQQAACHCGDVQFTVILKWPIPK
jgi:hypothetical protein